MPFAHRYMASLTLSAVLVSMCAFVGSALAQPVPFTKDPFTDVPKTHPYYEAIEYLRKNNIVRGYIDPADPNPQGATFKPDNRINRAEFVQLATNPFFLSGESMNDCLQEHFPGDSTFVVFTDVFRDVWYADEVCIANIKDLVNGYPDGSFKPGAYINFVEVAKILSNVFVLNTEEEPGENWHWPYVEKMGELHAIPPSVYRLNSMMTRGEMAEMLFRLKAQNTSKPSKTAAQLKNRYE
ncbi:S-layer homology domain-containing protein [Candidatus Peregrinibacteria bacterium]|nr:S-layer homology domain-containing protein [Candidatus Peregrinibacteria bacterium]